MRTVLCVLAMLSALTSGCSTTEPAPDLPIPKRPHPVEAMAPCESLCRLPERFDDAGLEEQARMILTCRIRDAAAYRLCSERQRALSEWIERD